jgi:hypothetical protein
MTFDIYFIGELCAWVFPLVVVGSLLFTAVIGALLRNPSYGTHLGLLTTCIFSIGVIVHELAHQLMCCLYGVQVKDTQYFKIDRKKTGSRQSISIGGFVLTEDISSFITGLSLGIAPLLINGFLVVLICYYHPSWVGTSYEGFMYYLGFALAFGGRPSKQDLSLWAKAFQKNPKRGLFELFLVIFFIVTISSLIIYEVNVWVILGVLAGFIITFILQGRSRPRASRQSTIERWGISDY